MEARNKRYAIGENKKRRDVRGYGSASCQAHARLQDVDRHYGRWGPSGHYTTARFQNLENGQGTPPQFIAVHKHNLLRKAFEVTWAVEINSAADSVDTGERIKNVGHTR